MPEIQPNSQAPSRATAEHERVSESLRERVERLEGRLQERVERLEAQLQALRMSTLAERRFALDGESYAYHVARGNRTWDNERAVEVPVAWGELQRRGHSEGVLEVGNVLGHYFDTTHPVLDKYEQDPGVTWNEDIVGFQPPFAPELILSISTLEHVGHSERPRDPAKFATAVDTVTRWLAPGGRLLFTVPLGYNPAVREYLDRVGAGGAPGTTVRCMRRTTLDNLWGQVEYEEVRDFRYDRPFPCANAIAFVEVRAR
ncbi:MAG TPA: hypothetical protein VID29_08315 [Solirubrobacteraceae bacterium]